MKVMNENKWTVKEKKSSTAYYLAEAGIERGYWTLESNPSYFSTLSTSSIAGYRFDQAYSDIPSTGTSSLGSYCILLSSYSLFGTSIGSSQRVITASGRDNDKKEIRTIEMVIQTPGTLNGAIQASGVQLSGGGKVHWGPLISAAGMTFNGGSQVRYPRKFMRLGITSLAGNTDNNPAEPNYDTDNPNPHTEFWSYNEPPGVPDAPTIDTNYYRNLAQYSTAAVTAGFAGGGQYYSGVGTTNIANEKDLTDTVYYSEGTLKFTGCVATRGVIVAVGAVIFTGGPCNTGQIPGRYPQIVSIPTGAWQEYQKIDTAASNEYPGDTGGPGTSGLNPTYTFGAAANSNIQTTETISHYGFIYAGGGSPSWNASGGTIVVGAVLAPNDDGSGSGGSTIYYQDNMTIQVSGTSGSYTRSTWHQKPAYWPDGLP